MTVAPASRAAATRSSTSARERALWASRHRAGPSWRAVLQPAVAREVLATPEDEGEAAGLEEDGLLDLLAPPAEPLVEPPRPAQVGDAERHELMRCSIA